MAPAERPAIRAGAVTSAAAASAAATSAAAASAGVTSAAIAAVAAQIRPYIRRTPVISLDRADFGLATGELVLKLEQLQHSGSFKARGAFTNLLRREIPAARSLPLLRLLAAGRPGRAVIEYLDVSRAAVQVEPCS